MGHQMTFEPRLIEHGFPCHQVGAETQRERGASSALPPLYFLHVWWARRPLTPSRAAILALLSPPELSPGDFLRQLGIEQRVVDIGGAKWVLTGDLLDRIRHNADGIEVLPVNAFVLRRFEKERQRRAKALLTAEHIERVDPSLASHSVLTRWKRDSQPLLNQWVREGYELAVERRAGDPALVSERIDFAKSKAVRDAKRGVLTWDAEDLYGYDRAFTDSADGPPNELVVLDPMAGGGSIPFEAVRLGHRVIANELNPVATAILYATLEYPVRFGSALSTDIRDWGDRLVEAVEATTAPFAVFSQLPSQEREHLRHRLRNCPDLLPMFDVPEHDHIGQLHCRQVMCPHCAGEAPLLSSCRLAKGDDEPWGVCIVTDGRKRGGKAWFETYRIVDGRGPNGADPDFATVMDGVGTCVHCRQAISGDEIKAQAQGRSEHGRWTDRLYSVVAVRFEPKLDAHDQPQRYKSGQRKGTIKNPKDPVFPPAQRARPQCSGSGRTALGRELARMGGRKPHPNRENSARHKRYAANPVWHDAVVRLIYTTPAARASDLGREIAAADARDHCRPRPGSRPCRHYLSAIRYRQGTRLQ
jgi:adenine-specific DNA methylase